MKIVSTQRVLPYVLLTLHNTGHIDEQRFASNPVEFLKNVSAETLNPSSDIVGYSLCEFQNYVYFPQMIIGKQPADRQALDDYIRKTLNRKEN